MPEFASNSNRSNTLQGLKSFLSGRTIRRVPDLLLLVCVLLCAVKASGQGVGGPQSASDPTSFGAPLGSPDAGDGTSHDATSSPLGSSTSLGSGPSLSGQNSFSASQIISILQQRPEAVVELKSLVADQLQQQGTQVQADDITDEMLYNQIQTNADLRARITVFLRVRGYVSEDDLQSLSSGISDTGATGGFSDAQSASSLSGTSGGAGLGAGAGLGSAAGLSALNDGTTMLSPGRTASPLGRNGAATQKPREQTVTSSTDEPKVLRSPAPYNLQSMRDLYTQIPERVVPLKRFGSEVFSNQNGFAMSRGVAGRDTPLDVPLGPDYIVGPGDTLTINLWGGVTQAITRIVDRDGRILLPEAGSINVAGLSLGRTQSVIEGALRPQYRNAQISVTVSQLRSVRVYVVGDVQRPGGFDISALATPLSALYAAGGPTAAGSLRTVRHFRGKTLVEEVDLYDFLLHGIRNEGARFESGDTLLVPPAGAQVAISGAVRRPAIYELKSGENTLASVIQDAGGFTVAAAFGHITIERIDANQQRETVTLDHSDAKSPASDQDAMAAFQVKDGDRIRVAPILPYSERAIYLEGHVVRPGRQAYREGMQLSDVLRSYQDMLPEPAAHGEIVRLIPPDLHAETIPFDVPDVLVGNANLVLEPFDTVRVFGRYEIDAPKVTINGEVLRPGSYPLSKGMTAAQLVRMAGGFKRDAFLDSADLTSYTITDGKQIAGNLPSVRIGAAVTGTDLSADIMLKPGDTLTIHQITGWNEIGESITINGQVAFPGSYGLREGEKLSSVLRRAGGFRNTAYPAGAVLVREQVRELEENSRQELIRQIETSSAAARLAPNLASGDAGATLQLIQAQQDQVLARLKAEPPSGRMVVHLSADIDSWANTPADIEMRRGDVLVVPKRPGFVLVTGQVYNATAITFSPGETASWYLRHAGGTNGTANRKEIFILRANGSVIGHRSGGWFGADVLATKLDPGDVIVVPQKVIGASLFWKNLLTAAQLASSIAITAAVASL
jgi:protein involved in polysaccharide export with SLBB domain